MVESERPSARRPAFTGLVVHRDPDVGYSLLLPDGWSRIDLPEADGSLFTPDPSDPTTGLEVSGRDLGTEVQAKDLPAIRRGFMSGLRQLPECRIEHQEDTAIGGLLTLEARLTYRQDDATRKRWVRLLYQRRAQVRLMAEGSTVERFGYWEPMFFTAFRTVRFGDWWSEATGIEWTENVLQNREQAATLDPFATAPDDSAGTV
jgi:hypothetical protein